MSVDEDEPFLGYDWMTTILENEKWIQTPTMNSLKGQLLPNKLNSCWFDPVLVVLITQHWEQFKQSVLLSTPKSVRNHLRAQNTASAKVGWSTYLQLHFSQLTSAKPEESKKLQDKAEAEGRIGCLGKNFTQAEADNLYVPTPPIVHKVLKGFLEELVQIVEGLIIPGKEAFRQCTPTLNQFLLNCAHVGPDFLLLRFGGFGSSNTLMQWLFSMFPFGSYHKTLTKLHLASLEVRATEEVLQRPFFVTPIEDVREFGNNFFRVLLPVVGDDITAGISMITQVHSNMFVVEAIRSTGSTRRPPSIQVSEELIQVFPEASSPKYLQLRATFMSDGTHWICWLKDREDQQWYIYDDITSVAKYWGPTLYPKPTTKPTETTRTYGERLKLSSLFYYDVISSE